MSVLERIDCSAVGSLHLIQVRFLCSFYYETSRLSRSLLYTSVPGSVGFKGRALCLLLKDHCCFSYIWTTSGVFNPLVITWQTWQIQTESTVQITLFGGSRFCSLFQIWPSVSWWSQLTLLFFPCLPLSHTLKSSQKLPGSPCLSIHGGLKPPSARNNGGAINFF